MPNFTVGRVMVQDDANLAGNVHGGTILKMIEEAGGIVGIKHCNQETAKEKSVVLLARVERTDFLEPVYVGELVQIHAELSYVAKHSLEVECAVYAENVFEGKVRLTNRASLWYVAASVEEPHSIVPVPPITYANPEDEIKGQRRYYTQKNLREEQKSKKGQLNSEYNEGEIKVLSPQHRDSCLKHSVEYSQSSFILTLHSSDCDYYGFASGGTTLKKMDNVAGVVAFRHCRTNVVTASVEAVDFHHRVKLGHVMTVTGRVVFSSSRTLDIEVFVDCEDILAGTVYRACSAIFTFVSLNKSHRPIEVPPLQLITEAEKLRFEVGKQRYLKKKEQRQKEQTVVKNMSVGGL